MLPTSEISLEQLSQPFSVLNIFLTGGDEQSEFDAVAVALSKCMTDRGWDLSPPPTVAATARDAFAGSLRNYIQVRRTNGYGTPQDTDDAAAMPFRDYQKKFDALSDSARATYNIDLYGESDDIPSDGDVISEPSRFGCYGQARASVIERRNSINLEELPIDYSALLDQVYSDDRILNAEQEWVKCMASAGYQYTSSEGPIREFAVNSLDGPPSPEELAIATVDSVCFARTIHPARRLVEIGALESLIEQYPEWSANLGAAVGWIG